MTRLTVDADLPKKLPDLTVPAELCDASGRVLGQFIPTTDMSQWEAIGPEITDEELERQEKSGERRFSYAEVRAHLENL